MLCFVVDTYSPTVRFTASLLHHTMALGVLMDFICKLSSLWLQLGSSNKGHQ